MNSFQQTIKSIKNLNINELSQVIMIAGGMINKLNRQGHDTSSSDEESDERKDIEDCDIDDYDSQTPNKTKRQLDIELIDYRLADPRLDKTSINQLKDERMKILIRLDGA